MSKVTVTIDGAAAVIAAAELRDRALRVRVADPLWSRQLDQVAAAMERELYTPPAACHCADPICPNVHPTDAIVGRPEVRYPVPANPMYEGMD